MVLLEPLLSKALILTRVSFSLPLILLLSLPLALRTSALVLLVRSVYRVRITAHLGRFSHLVALLLHRHGQRFLLVERSSAHRKS
jgi:hypothetical protein